MMYGKEEGREVDIAALRRRTRTAVGEVVDKQRRAGLDIVNDGEMSKPSYATYIKDRLSGFGGTRQHVRLSRPRRLPHHGEARLRRSGPIAPETPACNGPIAVSDPDGVRRDIDNLRAAIGDGPPSDRS